jgi:hypothetical protein
LPVMISSPVERIAARSIIGNSSLQRVSRFVE